MTALAEYGSAFRRHGPQAGPVIGLAVVGSVRKELPGHFQHGFEVAGLVAAVVSGELGRGGEPQTVAVARPGNKRSEERRGGKGWGDQWAEEYSKTRTVVRLE